MHLEKSFLNSYLKTHLLITNTCVYFSCVAQNGKGTVERKQTIVKVEAPAIEKTNLIGDPSSGTICFVDWLIEN